MVAKGKSKSLFVTLYSQAGTGYNYVFRRPRTKPKLMLRKYDPVVRQYVLFSEDKTPIPKDFKDNFVKKTRTMRETFASELKQLAKTKKMTILPPFYFSPRLA